MVGRQEARDRVRAGNEALAMGFLMDFIKHEASQEQMLATSASDLYVGKPR